MKSDSARSPDADDDRQEWAFEANSMAARAVQAWAVGRGFAAEIADLRMASHGDLIAAPGLHQAINEIEKASISACNHASVIYYLTHMDPEEDENARLEAAFEVLHDSTLRTEYWMRRLAELCKGVAACLSSTDAVERSERAAVIALKQGVGSCDLLGDGLWPRSRSFAEFTTELAGYLSRMIIDHRCRLTMTPVAGSHELKIHASIDNVGNLSLVIEGCRSAAVDALVGIGWERVDGGLVASWNDPLTVMEPVHLIIESLDNHLGIHSPEAIAMGISAQRIRV